VDKKFLLEKFLPEHGLWLFFFMITVILIR
jgi:hypothetical protein